MFTGLVREVGEVVSVRRDGDGVRLTVRAPATAADAALGDSISIGGVCLTVVETPDRILAFDAVPETLARTTLGRLGSGARVNLEPALRPGRPRPGPSVEPPLRAGAPLGGRYVQGHVDGVGPVRTVEPEGEGRRVWFDA